MKTVAPDDESGYPRRSYAWGVLGLLVATAIVSYTDRQVLSLLVDPVRHDLEISDTQISLLLGTAFAVIYGIAGIPFGNVGVTQINFVVPADAPLGQQHVIVNAGGVNSAAANFTVTQ